MIDTTQIPSIELILFVIFWYCIPFIIGILLVRMIAYDNNWENPNKQALLINIPWFFVNMIPGLIIDCTLFIISIYSFLINVIIGTIIFMKFSNDKFLNSLGYVIGIQTLLIAIAYISALIIPLFLTPLTL